MEEEKTNMTYRGEEKTEMPNLEETKVNYSHDMQEEKEDRSTSSAAHAHFAGRVPAGSDLPICVSKNGVNHVIEKHQSKKEILSIGLACSECFSGPRLAQLLQPGLEYEQQVMADLMAGKPAAPLSIHTSGGVPSALTTFINALEKHLPWKEDKGNLDWCVSLQLEGASAVMAGIDMLLQIQTMQGQTNRKMIAVGGKSYHGPPSTSFGSSCPLFPKAAQLTYPVPVAGEEFDVEDLLAKYEQFLNEYATCIGVLLIEPQWGSSQVALPWPEGLAKKYVKMAQERGILVLADEIMCGLGRHGKGTLFLSEAWDLNPDAVTFGKAIGGGVFPLSGAVIKVAPSWAPMASPSLFPKEYVLEFQKCLDSTEPLEWNTVKSIIEREVGPITQHFAYVDEKPLASASIAQVHAATLMSGEEVVIKVQKPRIDELLKADLNFIYIAS